MTQANRFMRAFAVLAASVVAASMLAQAMPAKAAFPGVNGNIFYSSIRDGDGEIYRISASLLAKKKLTDNSASDSDPAVSPNGKRIAFTSNRDGQVQGNVEIYTMDPDGTQVKRLTNNAGPGFQDLDFDPSFSPDGARISFTSYRNGNYEVYVMNAKGVNQQNLTKHPSSDWKSDWGPKAG